MSFSFSTALSGLRSKAEFDTYIADTTTYQASQAYTDAQAAATAATESAMATNICRRVERFFDQADQDQTDVSKTSTTVCTACLSAPLLADLTTTVQGKGYTTSQDGDFLTISSS